MKRFFLLALMCSHIFFSCKPQNSTKTTHKAAAAVAPNPAWDLLNQENISAADIATMRTNAEGMLEFRDKELNHKSVTIIDKDIWKVVAFIIGRDGKFGDKLHGAWIDFKEDLTYTYGHYDKTEGQGLYIYDLDKELILLIDDNQTMKPQEFKVKVTNDNLVLVGTETYRDNAMQAKLDRTASFPSAPAEATH
ncbi:MAG: hypothetical protein H6567_08340 [Lewinellaceae bacterium]|nr:hypothetical protein [Lewinellaceae bacterium]